MSLSSLSSTPSPSLSTQQASTSAPPHPGMVPTAALQTPEGMPTPRRAASTGPSGSNPSRTALLPTTLHEYQPAAEPARAAAGPGDLASLRHDFDMPLALADDNYAALSKTLAEVGREAETARAQWVKNGDRKDLAAAQTQAILGAVLNGLYSFRLHHKDWLSQTPVVSPETMANLLPLFTYALSLCEKESDAVQFPVERSPHNQLAHLQARVRESLQSLVDGQWQATAEGAWYGARHGVTQTPHPDSLPAPFAKLQVACRTLDEVLTQLQSTLSHGPAMRQAAAEAPAQASGPRSYKAVLGTDLPATGSAGTAPRQPAPPLQPAAQRTDLAPRASTSPAPAPREPRRPSHHLGPTARRGWTAPNTVAPTLPRIRTRPRHPATVARSAAPPTLALTPPDSPPALRPAADPGSSSPTATASPHAASVAAPPPVDPVAEAAAQLRQEQLAALKAALAPLQAQALSLIEAAEAAASRTAAGGLPWHRHTIEFKAWEKVVEAHDACTGKLKAEVGAAAGLDSGDPAVRSLQGAIDQACGRALERAARAADDTLAAFAQTCHTALVHGDPERAGVGSYTRLAKHCRKQHQQWQETPLRPRLPALEGRMAQYGVYETVCGVMGSNSNDKASILFNAEQVHEAATLSRRAFAGAPGALNDRLRTFHMTCTVMRSDMLEEAVRLEVQAVYATCREQLGPLQTARQRSEGVAAACDTLLIGDPLPQAQVREPGSEAAPAPSLQPALLAANELQIAAATRIAEAADKQCKLAIKLPAEGAPQRARHEQQGGLAVLQQLALTAETTADVMKRVNLLASTLEATPPEARAALVREHADAMAQRAATLQEAVRVHRGTLDVVTGPMYHQVKHSQTLLGSDLRLANRMQISLSTLERLLDERESARQLQGGLEQDPRLDLASHPLFTGQAHDAIAKVLKERLESVEQDLLKDGPRVTPGFWQAEKALHDLTASAMQRKIDGEAVLIQGRLLLAQAAATGSPGSGNPDHLQGHQAKVTELFNHLTKTNKALKELAASSEHKDRLLAQHAVNEEVRRGLLGLKLKLASSNSQPAGTAAGGSSGVGAPAARTSGTTPAAAEAPQGNKSSRRHRPAKHQ